MKDRIKMLMDYKHMNQQTFAKFLDLSPATLSSILSDRTRPTLNIVEAIHSKFDGLNLTWLLYGEGDMFAPQQSPDNVPQETPQYAMPTEQTLPFSSDQPLPVGATPVRRRPAMPAMEFNDGAKNVDKEPRRITEIRVFYDDQTWESFVPKK